MAEEQHNPAKVFVRKYDDDDGDGRYKYFGESFDSEENKLSLAGLKCPSRRLTLWR